MVSSDENVKNTSDEAVLDKTGEQYSLQSIDYDKTTGTVTISSSQVKDCTLVVGFYSDDEKQMYTSLKSDLTASENAVETKLTVTTSTLPSSYLIKAYLIDKATLAPLCYSLVYNKMTASMQNILNKTVDDFDSDKVLQFDESDKTNNFMVLNDNTKVIPSSETVNVLVNADEENKVYTFKNIDSSLSGLKSGDYMSLTTTDGTIVNVKVASITIKQKTAVIKGDTDDKDLYKFVKIDTSKMDCNAEPEPVDMSGIDGAVTLTEINGKTVTEDSNGIAKVSNGQSSADVSNGKKKAVTYHYPLIFQLKAIMAEFKQKKTMTET